jgi:hypothetical protein
MKTNHRTTAAGVSVLILTTASVLSQATSGGAQSSNIRLASPKPTLSVSRGAGTNAGSLTLMWDANAVGFVLQSRAAFSPGATWAALSGAPNPITGAGSVELSTKAGAGEFYQLNGPRGVGPRIAGPPSEGRVDVPILEAADRIPSTSLAVLLQPESATVKLSNSVTFAALVDGYTNGESLSFKWEWNKLPYTTNLVSTNSTWRDLNVGTDTNFLTVPGSPDTNVFTIASVTTNEVAYYRVTVTAIGTNGTNIASSAAAPLWAWRPTNSIYAYGTPVQLLNGSATTCPGPFAYVIPFPGVYPDPPATVGGPVNNAFLDLENNNTSIYWTTLTGRYTGWSCPNPPSFPGGYASIPYASKAATIPWYFTVYVPPPDQAPNPYWVYMTFH